MTFLSFGANHSSVSSENLVLLPLTQLHYILKISSGFVLTHVETLS